jgi:RimJ/RimL family protein N-acetyltransferase
MPGVTADLSDIDEFLRVAADDEALKAVVVDGEVVGHCSLHRRGDGSVGEIGYWVRTDRTGRGIAIAAVTSIMAEAPADIMSFTIKCDPANARSISVARRAGFTLAETGSEMVWTRSRA